MTKCDHADDVTPVQLLPEVHHRVRAVDDPVDLPTAVKMKETGAMAYFSGALDIGGRMKIGVKVLCFGTPAQSFCVTMSRLVSRSFWNMAVQVLPPVLSLGIIFCTCTSLARFPSVRSYTASTELHSCCKIPLTTISTRDLDQLH